MGLRSIVLFGIAGAMLVAQTPSPRPAFNELRYEEDWSFLRDSSKRSDFWDPVKYIGLGHPGWYTSIGGESRIRHEFFRSAGFGSVPDSPNGFLIQRYLVHADTHFGPYLRIFTQFQSGVENGRVTGPRATDKDNLELHQAFLDISTSEDKKRAVTFRIGRQELEFGAGHYLSASEVFNVRRSFDGVRIYGMAGSWTWNVVAAKPVEINPGFFDDSPDHRQSLWATGAFGPHPFLRGGNLSVYFLGFDRKSGRFDQGTGHEVRHTIGSRHWGKHKNLDYNDEVLFQWGDFGGGHIRAWAVSTDTGYSIPTWRFRPRLALRGNAASGDKNPANPSLETFNPLFPTTAYSGKIGLIGASNVMDITPAARFALHRRVYFLPECSFFWRQSLHDGIYSVLGLPQRTGRLSQARYVGTQLSLPAQVQIERHLTWTVLLSRFWVGDYLKQTPPGRSVLYMTNFLTYRF